MESERVNRLRMLRRAEYIQNRLHRDQCKDIKYLDDTWYDKHEHDRTIKRASYRHHP